MDKFFNTKNRKQFMKNLIATTFTTFTISIIATFFSIFEANTIGPKAIGLMTLVFSVYYLTTNFAVFGIQYAVTKLVSESIALSQSDKNTAIFSTQKIMKMCFFLSLIFSITTAILIFIFADFIAIYWIKSDDVTLMIRVLACSLPFFSISLSSRNYFLSKKKSLVISLNQFIEILTNITFVFATLSYFSKMGVKYSLLSIALGMAIGEVCGCCYIFLCYMLDRKKNNVKNKKYISPSVKTIFSIALPIGTGATLRSMLNMLENMLIPQGLIKSGKSSSDALKDYGVLKGMVMPIISFPQNFLMGFSMLLIPEVAQLNVVGNKEGVKRLIDRVLRASLIFSFFVMGIFLQYSSCISEIFYKSSECVGDIAKYLLIICPIIPFLYFDSIVDNLLKGLNEQVASLKINLIDTCIRIFLLIFLLPKTGILGCILVIFSSEVFNCTLSLLRLLKVTDYKLTAGIFIKPIVFSCISFGIVYVLNFLFLAKFNFMQNDIVSLVVKITLAILIYIILVKNSIFKKQKNIKILSTSK